MKYLQISGLVLALCLGVTGCQEQSKQTQATPTPDAGKLSLEAQNQRQIAQQLGENYAQIASQLKQNINVESNGVPLNKLVNIINLPALTAQAADTEKMVIAKHGLNQQPENLLTVSLANPAMLPGVEAGQQPLFTYQQDNVKAGDSIDMFDSHGELVIGSADVMPNQPVFIVGVDEQKAMRAGLATMQSVFNANDAVTLDNLPKLASAPKLSEEFLSTTVLKKISVKDDQEPWISGKAEIYALVSGVDPSRDEPTLDVVEMPYLDYQDQVYYPNQIMVYWARYRWGAANIILMEHDTNTNYRELAEVIIKTATTVIASQIDGGAASLPIVNKLVDAILKAIPDETFTNNDDMVDFYYTIMQTDELIDQPGASNNATITLEPREIPLTK
ncbi:hypothetical protein A3K86_05645 [Photobacterium jeanii]|uniref:DUF3103 domain-containing protein n=1 Tax=Photobacterium jeanii TaxID=858640 RepID=A0A178KN14_9GAMM|nr:DUF3103 family protein [Photobacterium jeanii]OAN18375.1 hypothetical protein A3K86_05645 [Photobacterium jeanii]PST91944.1 DUF3103 domain-containing protein [Photobacterium jeanii]